MQPLVRNVVLQFALELAGSLNVDTSKLLASSGISEKAAYLQNGHIPTAKLIELVERAAQESRRKDFGILWGNTGDFRTFGAMGIVIAHHDTLSAAMRELGEHLSQLGTGYTITSHSEGQTGELGLVISVLSQVQPRHYTEGMLTMFLRFVRLITGNRWKPTLIRFAHQPLDSEENYRQKFGCRVEFGADKTAAYSPRSSWEQSITISQTPVNDMIKRVLDMVSQLDGSTTRSKVAIMAPRLLAAGKANATHIAELMDMSPRTLQRKLAEENTTLKQILNEAREVVITDQLKQGHSSGEKLAQLLGYSEPSAASRFIKAHTGKTTRDLKAQARRKSS